MSSRTRFTQSHLSLVVGTTRTQPLNTTIRTNTTEKEATLLKTTCIRPLCVWWTMNTVFSDSSRTCESIAVCVCVFVCVCVCVCVCVHDLHSLTSQEPLLCSIKEIIRVHTPFLWSYDSHMIVTCYHWCLRCWQLALILLLCWNIMCQAT